MSGGKPQLPPPHQRALRMRGVSAGSPIFFSKGRGGGEGKICLVSPAPIRKERKKMITRNVVREKGKNKEKNHPPSIPILPSFKMPFASPPQLEQIYFVS